MRLRDNYRLYPTPGQQIALARLFGCVRIVFNDGLRARQQAHEAGQRYVTDTELSARLTAAKTTPERAWLAEVSAVPLQQSLADLNTAYRRFFDYRKALGEWWANGRKGPRPRKVGPPQFKSRKDRRQTARFTANARYRVLANGRLRLPKIGDIRVRWSRDLPSDPSSVTVIKDASGRYFASFVVETDPTADGQRFARADSEVGIDLGLTAFAVLSDGTKVQAPGFCAAPSGSSNALSGRTAARRGEAGTRTSRGSGWPVHTLGSPTGGPTSTIRSLPRSSATTKRSTWRTFAWPGSAGPGWHIASMTPGGPGSSRCWSTRRPDTVAGSPRLGGSSPPRESVQPAGSMMARNRSASGNGPALRAGRSKTET
jgi:Helix-turn-helix domain